MKKKLRIALIIIVALILLFPMPFGVDDGGTVVYNALLYKVSKVHRLNSQGREYPYLEGTIVEVLGITIYNDVK